MPKIFINKLKLFQQTPTNIKEFQMEEVKILENDLDEEAVKLIVKLEDSQA